MFTKEEFTCLAEQHMDMVYRLAFSYLKNPADAEDITQTVLLRLYQSDKVFAGDAHIRNWLLRVTINECKKHWRSPWRKVTELPEDSPAAAPSQPPERELFQAILALKREERLAVVLHYYEGYTLAEISRLLHIPTGTVGTRLSRARSRLKKYLTEAD